MFKPSIITAALAVTLSLVGCTTTPVETTHQSGGVIISPADAREYATMQLDNGITVMLVSDPSVDKSAAALSVGVGLLHDPMTQQGMAHYLEHMLFMGTEKYPEPSGYSEFMSQNGGSSNAYTWLDITNYMFEINNEAFDQALDRFSDFFKTPKLYPEYTDKEKNAVNAEWSMRREMDFFGMFKLNRSMMGSHPANRFLIGNLETLSDKEESKLHPETVAFYNQFYSGNIMKVALVSQLPIEQMKQLAEKHFSAIANKNIEKPNVTATIDFAELGRKRIHYVPNQDVKQLIIDFTIENNVDDYRTKPNRFISYLLGSEMPGTAAYELKKAGLISSLSAGVSPDMYGNYGQLSVQIDLTDAGMQQREKIVAVVMNYIDLIKQLGVDEKYFDEIKTSLANQFRFLEKGNSFGYVSNLADELQSYDANEVIAAPYLYQKFDASSIKKVLDQLTPERLRIWYISKQEPHNQSMHFYDGKYQIDSISEEEVASWSQPKQMALNLPQVNTLLPKSFDIKQQDNSSGKPQVVYDEQGIKVWKMASSAFKEQPKGLLKAYINTPQIKQSVDAQIYLAIWTDLFNLQQSALLTEAQTAGMNLSLANYSGLELSLGGFTDKQSELLKKGLQGLKVTVDKQSFNAAVDRYMRDIANKSQQFPVRQLGGFMSSVVSEVGVEDEVLIAEAKKVSLDGFNQFMQQTLSNNVVRMFAFGNYDDQDVNSFVKQIRSVLPKNRTVSEYTRSKQWKPSLKQSLVLQKDLPVADVAILDAHIHPDPSVKQQARARVLMGHIRTATFEKLRTEEQLGYAVGATTRSIDDYTGLAFLIQTPVKNVVDMQKRFDDYKIEYAQKLAQLTDEEFEQLKTSTLVELKEAPKNLSEEVSPMLNDWYNQKWDFNTREILIAEVEKVSKADIQAFYNETMLNADAARLSIQLRGQKFQNDKFADLPKQTLIKDLDELHKNISFQ